MLEINPTFRDLIPPLSKEEYAQLESNCLQDGIMHPIITWRGQIIDGHNRYNIVQEHGIDFRTEAMEFESEADAIVWIIQHQMGRRNLNAYNRSVLALKMEGVLKAEGERKKREAGAMYGEGHPKQEDKQISAKPLPRHETRKEVAKLANVSHDTIAKVKAIEAKATPEQKQALATGEESIHSVYKQVQAEEKTAHVSHNSGENEWYTPDYILQSAVEVLGVIDLDPASNPIANQKVGATVFYTKEDDGLNKDWFGRVWLNPPYAQPLMSHFA